MPSNFTSAGMPKNILKYVGEKKYKVRIKVGELTYKVGIYTDLGKAIRDRDAFVALPVEEKIRLAKDKSKTKLITKSQPSPELKGTPFYGL